MRTVDPFRPGDLAPGEKALLAAEVLAAYLPAWRRLRRDDLRSMVHAARSEWPPRRGDANPSPETLRAARRLGRAVEGTLRLLPTDTRCLVSSLVLARLLSRRGIEHRVVVAAVTEPHFSAHAWVEHAGSALLEPGGPDHQRLVEL